MIVLAIVMLEGNRVFTIASVILVMIGISID